MAAPRTQVAESAFSYLHMEMVQMALGPEKPGQGQNYSTSQLQHASRKIEQIGFDVGMRLVERYTKDRARFADTLEIIKFICKDFWMEVYRKQIDKLQTNNRVHACEFFPSTLHPAARALIRSASCMRVRSLAGCLHAAGQHAPSAHAMLGGGGQAGDLEADGVAPH